MSYEPPRATLIGNMHDLVANVRPFLEGVCRACGCTVNEPCFSDGARVYRFSELETLFTDEQLQQMTLNTCSWIEPDLCSMCVETPAPALLVDQYGQPLRGAP